MIRADTFAGEGNLRGIAGEREEGLPSICFLFALLLEEVIAAERISGTAFILLLGGIVGSI